MVNALTLDLSLPVQVSDAGMLVSRGVGRHPERVWQTFDLLFVRSGELGMQEEGQEFTVGPGQTLLLWPGRRHGGTTPYAPGLSFYWIHFTLGADGQGEGGPALAVPQHATVNRPDHLTELLRRFLDDQESGALDPTAANLLLLLMLGEIARSQPPRAEGNSTGAVLAGRADRYVRTHFHQPLSASGVAAELGCNPNYLARLFRETYGRTLTQAIQGRRLDYARRLLLDEERNIDEVARACGFEDAGYFRRLFKRREGLTPFAFRRLYARTSVNTE